MFFASEVSGGSTNLLVFEISHVEYCLSNRIQYSIVKPDNIFQLGAIKRSKYSLLRIDDKSIPLIDLKKFLTDEKQRINNNSRIIITPLLPDNDNNTGGCPDRPSAAPE